MLAAAACVAQLMGEHDATGAGVFAAVVDGAGVLVTVVDGAGVVPAVVDGSLVLVLGSAVDAGSAVVELSPSA